ncbi:superoxide dismutase family protein [Streptomyces sp. NPDC093094]|uniref:superoxide dismutase family protein n=1 Tax=Streptomyces sp. NPDC093094 TaxID=3366026 RepID=UPI0037FBA6F8
MRTALWAAAAAATLLAPAGSAGASGIRADGYRMSTQARFAPPAAFVPSAAITYDMDLVPAAARIEVAQETEPLGATTVRLAVEGLEPGRAYGAYVHREPCGPGPAAAGGRYRHVPGTGEDHVHAGNEVWLNFTPGGDGAAAATARHGWGFRRGEASSVVLYDGTGGAAAPVGCFTVPFGWVA